jgi:hypothetical protein
MGRYMASPLSQHSCKIMRTTLTSPHYSFTYYTYVHNATHLLCLNTISPDLINVKNTWRRHMYPSEDTVTDKELTCPHYSQSNNYFSLNLIKLLASRYSDISGGARKKG